ncbi:hypothetical protein HNP99_001249 [Flavobacterium sp. 28A]|uniref:DUF6642 family protein n=1 Tax=Flavobacterium sp. 28A TaxID=2735895 RepID=UPI0015707C24|nr:DUF6642 family protein [Flavobacterium sp. 28A]NRT14905.1 hypothetical protein [Flavobacterium sp. 28A]
MIAKHYDKHIFCLEGDWNENLKVKSSILPALELLQLNLGVDSIYKTCATKDEFFSRIEQLLNNKTKYGKYQIIYLAFHGFKGGISLGDNIEITLDELAEQFEGRLDNKMIHFGSCSTLSAHEDDIYNFLEKTAALSISGYQKDIAFISSTVVDLLFFELCQKYKPMRVIDNNMTKNYESLCQQLEFKMYY